jgi:two-component system sensor histidine kinase KdpD
VCRRTRPRAQRGKLKIFFGFAPGVGKTYADARGGARAASLRGLDVVVGVVETHGRFDTAACSRGSPVLPRKIELPRALLEELDLDAALARKPEVLLVDELAHTNAPGSRHPSAGRTCSSCSTPASTCTRR